jgi:putative selenate reductase FAD-binding subunit
MEILRPETIREAMRAKARPDSAFLGGGTWLNSSPDTGPKILISLEKLGLGSIERTGGSYRLGACVTFQQILDAPDSPDTIRKAASLTASRTMRNMVTIGGEMGLCPPQSAVITALLALEAKVEMAGRRRAISIANWLKERPAGLILGISVEDPSRPSALANVSRTSHGRRSLVIAVAASAVRPILSGVRIAANDCRGRLLRLDDVEKLLEGKPLPAKQEIEDLVRQHFSPKGDIHSSAEFKRYIGGVMVADLLHSLGGSP